MGLITYAIDAARKLTGEPIDRCEGSDQRTHIKDDSRIHNNAAVGLCPNCGEYVPVRFSLPKQGPRGIRPIIDGHWVTLPHTKPPLSHCADCGEGIYANDYLCARCRAC